jgi:hypothetical protein
LLIKIMILQSRAARDDERSALRVDLYQSEPAFDGLARQGLSHPTGMMVAVFDDSP